MSNPEMVGKSIALIIMGAYLIYRLRKLPKKAAIYMLVIFAVMFATLLYMAVYHPETYQKISVFARFTKGGN
ncbi:hypothetical protein [Sporosarcina jiandibaonis]|uniref:hypothetical protein n=1 Tax=Sporosarcina jiandibaonis TaxID=2715535 RepID=UPI001555EE7E|nr:hypothetical protein [Sporosarcina jiandibaonis]